MTKTKEDNTKQWHDLEKADKIALLIGVLIWAGFSFGLCSSAANLNKNAVQQQQVVFQKTR